MLIKMRSAAPAIRETLCYSKYTTVYCGAITWETDLNIMATQSFCKASVVYGSFSYINFKSLNQTAEAATYISSCHLYHSSKSNKADADRKASLHAYTYLCMHGRHTPIQRQTEGNVRTHTYKEENEHTLAHTHTVLSKQ